MKRILKIVLGLLGGTLLFLVLLAAVTQTQFFRDRLRSAALSNLNSLLDADVHLGELQGNLVTGFSIDSIEIASRGKSLLRAERVELKYNLLEIPGRTISVRGVTIINPFINLLRLPGERWNFEEIIRPRPSDTTAAQAMSWVVRLDRIEIRAGTIRMTDSASLVERGHEAAGPDEVEYHAIALRNFNLVASADVRSTSKQIGITSLSFLSDTPPLELKHLSGSFTVTSTGARVKGLTIVTGRSSINLDASMDRVDLFGGLSLERLRECPVTLNLKAEDLDFDEFKMFLPPLSFLHGPVRVDLAGAGQFGNIAVQRLDVKFLQSELRLKGSVENLHEPRNLYLDVRIVDSHIVPADPLTLLPDFDLPDFSAMGPLRFVTHYQGTPLDFRTKGVLEFEGGAVESDLALAIGGPDGLKYDGTLGVRGLNLARLFDNPSLESNLIGGVRIAGKGVSLQGMTSMLTVDIDSSVFRGRPLRDTHVKLSADNGELQGKTSLRLGPMSSALSMSVRKNGGAPPVFSVDGDIRSIPVSVLVSDENNDYLLHLRIRAKGSGATVRSVSGELDADFAYHHASDTTESSGTLHLAVDQADTLQRTLLLESSLGSVSLSGAFDLPSMVRVLALQGRSITRAVREQFAFLDTTGSWRQALAPAQTSLTPLPKLDARFTVQVEDLEPLAVFIPSWDGFGTFECTGAITGSPDETSITGHLSVDEFAYGRVEGGMLVEGGDVQFSLLHMNPQKPLDLLAADVRGTVQSLHVNKNEFDSVRVDLGYSGDSARFSGASTLNGTIDVHAAGAAYVRSDTAVMVRLDTLHWAYLDYAWDARPGARIDVASSGGTVSGLVLRRGDQEILVDASLRTGGGVSGLLTGRRLDLDGLRFMLSEEDRAAMGRIFDGIADLRVTLEGTIDQPVMTGSITAEQLAYRTVPFGVLEGMLAYRDRTLTLQVSVDEHRQANRDRPHLFIAGTIPLDLGFRGVERRVRDDTMHLVIRADSMQIGILDPLLPTFDQLTGLLTCTVNVAGTPRHPLYDGEITLAGCSFLFVTNNITYLIDGRFKPVGERIRVVDAVVRNIPADEAAGQKGLVRLSGDFSLADMRPGDFDLTATGKLLVVKESTARSSLSVYGRLFVEIGAGGLHFTGSIDQSTLKGDLLVRNSSLIFPPTRTARQMQEELTVPVLVVDDTAKTHEEGRSAAARYFGGGNGTTHAGGLTAILPTKSFMDGVRYDLDIETSGGNTEIRMIFNPGEELDATIDGKFSITEDGKKWFGDLTIERASYNFLKRFNATGKISFAGDFNNPTLDIQATYEGVRKTRDTTATVMETSENVVVTIAITGTRFQPKLAMSMKIGDYDYASYPGPTSKDVQSDAIQFILYGSFPLTSSQKNDVSTDVRSAVGPSILTGASSMLTGAISDFLRTETGFINSVELSYGTGDNVGQRTDIRLSGVAFNGLWRYGGKSLSVPFSNANFSLLYSFGTIFNDPALRNLMFELERRVQDVTLGQSNSTTKGVNSVRLFYRFSF